MPVSKGGPKPKFAFVFSMRAKRWKACERWRALLPTVGCSGKLGLGCECLNCCRSLPARSSALRDDVTTYLSSGLSSCLGNFDGGFEPCLKLLPSTTEVGCGISSEGFAQPSCICFAILILRPIAMRWRQAAERLQEHPPKNTVTKIDVWVWFLLSFLLHPARLTFICAPSTSRGRADERAVHLLLNALHRAGADA